jgi:hypothetical protein
MLTIADMPLGFSDAENYKRRENKDLLTRIFVRGSYLDKLCTPPISFLIGEKGTGKTAYAVYLSTTAYRSHAASVRYIRETEYQKFITLKRERHLDLSDYAQIWQVIIYLLLAQHIRDEATRITQLARYARFNQLAAAIDEYYLQAFSPEIIFALQFIEKSKLAAELLAKHAHIQGSLENELSFSESRFQTNLLYIQRQFETALRSIRLSRNHLLFIDGIDIRPASVPYGEYLQCIKGLANAVWAVNNDFFSTIRDSPGRMRVVLLIRPDIFQSLELQNQNAKIRDNSVVLDWRTTYKEHRSSGLFEVTDQLLRAGQAETLQVGEAWDHYFPFDSPNVIEKFSAPSSFVGFLRLSLYRPRDFVTMLHILQDNVREYGPPNKADFSFADVDAPPFRGKLAEYLLGEVKDHLLFYYSAEEYESVLRFFEYLKGHTRFSYDEYNTAFRETARYLKSSRLPVFMDSAETFLQFLYDLNMISFIEQTEDGNNLVRWCFRERSYSNIAPKVKVSARYEIHYGMARALNIGSRLV